MEGKGSYNRHARIPAGGIALALPLLEKTVRNIELDGGDQPVVIADYGSSQGKNSLAPMRVAIKNLRPRLGPNRPIFVFHVDQPSNDFNTLFEVLDTDPDTYTLDEPNVYPCAIGRSFYEKVLPARTVTLAWSLVCGCVAEPCPNAGSGPFQSTSQHRPRARRVRAPGCGGLEGFSFFACQRIAAWGPSHGRAAGSQ